jgi:hypothetical protein
MSITRRRALALAGAALAAPYFLRAQRAEAAATLSRVGNPIILGAGQSGGKHSVRLAAFPNPVHGFIAGWQTSNGANSRNYIQYFKSDGTSLSAPIPMEGPAGTTSGIFPGGVFPIARPDGAALILFSAAPDGQDSVDVFSQRMSATRAKIGSPTLVDTVTELDQGQPLGTRLSNGNFLAAWTSTPGGETTTDARGRVIAFPGVGITGEFRINPDVPGQDVPQSAAALSGGKSVVSYSSIVGDDWYLRATVLNANGTRAHTPFQLKKATTAQRLGSAAVVAKGDNQNKWVAIGYHPAASASQARLFFREFDLVTASPTRLIGPAFTCDDGVASVPPHASMAGANLVFVQHYAVFNNKQSIEGLVVDLATRTVKAPRIVIHQSATDTQSDALVRLPQSQIYVSGFSEGDFTDSSTSKAIIQRMKLTLS